MNDNWLVEHLEHVLREISILESRIKPHDCGYLHTTVNTLEQRVLEIKKEITKNDNKTHPHWGSTTVKME